MADGGPKAEEQEVVVEAVRVSGNKRTQRRALDAALADVSAQRSLKGLKCALQESTERLERSGSFHSVDAVLDAGSGPKAAQVQLSLTERDPFSFSAGTYLRAGEASVEARLRSRNGLGLLEDLSLNASRGTNSSTSLRLSASFPLVSKPSGTSIDGVAFASESNFQRHSSFSERLTGASASLSLPNSHLAYDLAWRELADLSKHHTASRAIRSQLVCTTISAFFLLLPLRFD
jgi:outer membrane protein assembly factor BamA